MGRNAAVYRYRPGSGLETCDPAPQPAMSVVSACRFDMSLFVSCVRPVSVSRYHIVDRKWTELPLPGPHDQYVIAGMCICVRMCDRCTYWCSFNVC